MSLLHFPYPIKHITELPTPVQQALRSRTQSSETFQSILLIPPFQHLGRRPGRQNWLSGSGVWRTPESTLALTEEHLFVVARDTATSHVETTVIPLKSMIAFEWGIILLYSWIDIVWADSELHRTHVEYNTVGESLLQPWIETLRRVTLARTAPPIEHRSAISEAQLRTALPMKFANMLLLHALLKDEFVYTWSFEPTRKPKWFWGGWRDGLLWAVTNYHSLLIREPREAFPYGAVFTFCPRSEIREARVVENDQGLELRLTLGEPGFQVTGLFPLTRRDELVANLELLTPNHVMA
jgi:hypothetical protein